MREKLLGWLESNSTITEKAPEAGEEKTKAKAKSAAKKKAKAEDAEAATTEA